MAIRSALCAVPAFLSLVSAGGWQSPEYPANAFFSVALPIPPVKTPLFTFTSPQTGLPVDYFEVDIKPFTQKFYPQFPATRLVGYDGLFPGPTFKITQGRESIVRYINHADRPTSIHLHGSYSRSPFDGYADDTINVGEYKDYYYPNSQNARTLWYHDHAVHATAENVYFGQAGFYIMHDAQELATGIPQGDYDIPLGISAHRYNKDGSLWDPVINKEVTSVYGDVIEVNGQPWPFMKVEPRKYRFRLLDLGVSRTYKLYLLANQQNNKRVNFTVIGADAGLLAKPISIDTVTMSIAERWEVVIDFAGFSGQNITMMNERGVGADSDFEATDRVMRFVVGNIVTSTANNNIPAKLRDVPFPPPDSVATRTFEFARGNGEWQINGVTWSDVAERVLGRPQRGSIEKWTLKNGGGGWSHPIHIHLIDFQVIQRINSNRAVLPYEAVALQDVVWLGPGETVTVMARFAPWPGQYMFHCHNLIHEDHDMLAEFNVTQVAGLGLNETELFINPLEPQYRAVPFNQGDLNARAGPFSQQAIQDKVFFFTAKNAYADVKKVEAALEAFWNNKAQKEKRSGSSPFGIPALERRDMLNGYSSMSKRTIEAKERKVRRSR
ncbi:Cupredoxin [Microthyrium microscopicum]|uniref:Cupredoxin n=1 Tax=Microthyrium microscopicum TaxID=703497 RepID=A0A6A6UWN3_9PEZI|nr:Cupredoxin [Microthyrium microscopicum]